MNTDQTKAQDASTMALVRQDGGGDVQVPPAKEVALHLPLGADLAAWILWLMARDLAQGWRRRTTRLTAQDALAAAYELHDRLEPHRRTPLPARRDGRGRNGGGR